MGSGVSQAGIGPLVSGAGSWGSQLRGPRCRRAVVSLLVSRARAQGRGGGQVPDMVDCGVLGILKVVSAYWYWIPLLVPAHWWERLVLRLVLAHWWVRLCPSVSGQPTGGLVCVPAWLAAGLRCPSTGADRLVGGAGSRH